MMLIWRGWGILVPAFAIAAAILAVLTGEAVLGPANSRAYANLLFGIALGVAAAGIWLAGRRLNRNRVRIMQDVTSGETIRLTSFHSFFFVRMEYWAIPAAVLAVCAVVLQFTAAAPATPSVGGLYSLEDGAGSYAIGKVVAVSDEAISVRIYDDRFDTRPASVVVADLDSGSAETDVLPLSMDEFQEADPALIQTEPVTAEELVTVQRWEDNGGQVLDIDLD